ncbi:MAG: hypothetical protein JXR81_08245 [Candidatus Goldbacteria bacterium]|nr:hypothetical protein [Candidatus Goldiibacteriota bacterium]
MHVYSIFTHPNDVKLNLLYYTNEHLSKVFLYAIYRKMTAVMAYHSKKGRKGKSA